MIKKNRLMVPGPTPIPPDVCAAGSRPLIDDRTVAFGKLFTEVTHNLKQVFQTEHDVLIFASSITGAFEGALENLFSPGDTILIANNGYFGRRWVQMSRAFGLEVIELAYDWGQPVDNNEVTNALASNPEIKGAICVHCETSTGIVNNVRGFAEAAKNVLSIVDAASSLGACELRTDEWGIDVVVAGSQKALMSPPGLAFVSVSERAWRMHKASKMARYYFDWTETKQAYETECPRTPWTPAISLINQLDVALKQLLAEGLENVFWRHILLGRSAREGIKGMGLQLFVPDEDRSAAVTTVWAPKSINADDLVHLLEHTHGIQVAGGQGPVKGKIFRIGHCGYFDAYDIIATIAAIELALQSLDYPVEFGKGVGSAQRVFAKGEMMLGVTPTLEILTSISPREVIL